MSGVLYGRTALVTGASGGIGAAIALRISAEVSGRVACSQELLPEFGLPLPGR